LAFLASRIHQNALIEFGTTDLPNGRFPLCHRLLTHRAGKSPRYDLVARSRQGPSQVLGVELVQQLLEGFPSCPTGHRHGLKIDRRLLYRACSPGAINLPSPRLRRGGPVLHDDGIIGFVFVEDHTRDICVADRNRQGRSRAGESRDHDDVPVNCHHAAGARRIRRFNVVSISTSHSFSGRMTVRGAFELRGRP
jgi:hypothetical protein